MAEKKESNKTLEVSAKVTLMSLGMAGVSSGFIMLNVKDLFGLILLGAGLLCLVAYQLIKKYF